MVVLLPWLALGAEPPDTTIMMTERVMGVDGAGKLYSKTSEVVAKSYALDLDGDGVLDEVVPVFAADTCSWSLRHAIWLRRGEDWVAIGEVVGEPALVQGLIQTHTMEVVATGPRNRPPVGAGAEPPERRETHRTYRIEGDKVVLVDEKVTGGTCHHCGVTDCLGAKLGGQ